MSGISKFIGRNCTSKEVREAVVNEMRRVLRGEIVDYSFVKTNGENQFYSANYFPEFNVTVGVTAYYDYDSKSGELYHNAAWEFSGSIWQNCPKKILQKLSPIAEIMKSGLEKDTAEFEYSKWAQEWRDVCYMNLKARDEKEKISKKNLLAFAKVRGDFQLKCILKNRKEYIENFKSADVASFKIRGNGIETTQNTFTAKNAETARKALVKIKKAFIDGAAGFNLSTMTAF